MNASMYWIVVAVAVGAWGATGPLVFACGGYGPHLDAIKALDERPAVAREAIARLRALGPEGLEELLAVHADMAESIARGDLAPDAPQCVRLKAALDAVGAQRNCAASRLFWHTDLETAKAEAARTGRPIVSLRLLGKLTDELSCANSRFFRSTLYANAEVSEFLRSRCVLHWESVRPVPVVTIDFGDGRTLRRTVTGNSIHYILDADGSVLDGLPGLYGPKAFLRELGEAVALASEVKDMPASERGAKVRQYHEMQARAVAANLQADLERVMGSDSVPSADALDEPLWRQLAELHRDDASLDAASIEVIRTQQSGRRLEAVAGVTASGNGIPNVPGQPVLRAAIPAEIAGALAIGKGIVEDPILRVVRPFEASIALDTVRNEYRLHRTIHEWIADGSVPLAMPVNQLNERVYAELFLTPSSDPWLGLTAGDAYTALENGGLAIR